MSNINIQRAFEKRLALMSPALSTAYENDDFVPVANTAYQKTFLLSAQPENESMGDSYHREVGAFQITLCYPMNGGAKLARERADLVASHFPRATSMTESGQVVQVIRTPTISPSYYDKDRYCIPITIYYRSDVFS